MQRLAFPLILIVFFSFFAISGYSQTATASALGLKEIKSLDIATGFHNNISANTNNSALFYFNNTTFVDGISSIKGFYGLFVYEKKSLVTQTWNFYLNGIECQNSPYMTIIGQTQLIVIACFNEPQIMNVTVNKTNPSTVFNFTFITNRDTDNLFRRVFITYVNNPDFSEIDEHFSTTDLIFSQVYEGNLLSNHDFCALNNTVSRKQLIFFNNVTNVTSQRNIDTFCDLGCDNNTGKCSQTPLQSSIWAFVTVFIIIAIALLLLRSKR